MIERSLPIVIETRATRLKLEEPEIWFVRVMRHPIKGKCLDIRLFNKVEDDVSVQYEPTDIGLVKSMEEWPIIIDALIKLFRKHKEK